MKQKVDYKELLNENAFAIVSKLRECRKIIVANDAVPAFAVYTDEELSGIAHLPVVRKYFDSIAHAILKSMLTNRFKNKVLLQVFFQIIDRYQRQDGKVCLLAALPVSIMQIITLHLPTTALKKNFMHWHMFAIWTIWLYGLMIWICFKERVINLDHLLNQNLV